MSMTVPYKPVAYSHTVLSELMVPGYANFGGKVHGGTLLSMMDRAAYVCSSKHADTYCVTVSVDTVDFLEPVEIGDLVSLYASVNYVGKSSLIVGIKVVAESLSEGTARHTNTSFFTMVAMDEDRKPVAVPGLLLQNEEEVRRFVEGKLRKEFKARKTKELHDVFQSIDTKELFKRLEAENCRLDL